MDPQLSLLVDVATRPYLPAGRHDWQFARWKLRLDPVFAALLRRGILPDRGRLLDLGCGQGILLTLLVAARTEFHRGRWPRGWPPPPLNLELQGIEVRQDRVQAARRALGDSARVDAGDVRHVDFPPCSAIVLLDVLFYLGGNEQARVLERAARALEPGGLLVLREPDAGAGFRFRLTQWSERLLEAGRGHLRNRLHYRSEQEWSGLIERLGFTVDVEPMSAGTPFANVLFVARKGRKRPDATADERG